MKHLLILVFGLLPFLFFAQDPTVRENIDLRQEDRSKARQDIYRLKNTALIVRIKTNSNKIDYYRKHGNDKEADKIYEQTWHFNKMLRTAIDSMFNFCPVFYFPDTFSMQIADNQFDKVQFYNENFQLTKDVQLIDSNFFVAEYAYTMDSERLETNMGVPAFVIMDHRFNQLREPFPYYSKFSDRSVNINKLCSRIKTLNEQLLQFLNKN